jgi:SulP family sulfate permease
VVTDLAIAVVVGVIVSALVFAWESAKHIDVRDCIQEATGAKVYHVTGQLFFSSSAEFQEKFDPQNDPEKVIIDFKNARVWDHSALEAIEALAARYDGYGKMLQLRHLSRDCQMLLERSGLLITDKEPDDPNYGLAVDYASKYGNGGH